MATNAPETGNTQTGRRIKYGVNVAISIIAAFAIVVIVNIISFRYFEKLRKDTTHSRLYSLSDQTRKLLKGLKNDYRISTVVLRSNEYYDNAQDLIDEYAYYSPKVTVDRIDPTASRGQKFYEQLSQRYEQSLGPVRKAIERGQQAHAQASDLLGQPTADLRSLLNEENLSTEQSRFFAEVANFFTRFSDQTTEIKEEITRKLDHPLPDVSGLVDDMRRQIEALDQGLEQSVDRFGQWVDDDKSASSVKEVLLKLNEDFNRIRQQLAQLVQSLNDVPTPEAYNKVRTQLADPDTVVVMGDDEVRVIPLNDMFRRPDPNEIQEGEPQQVELSFIGEEQITGALVGMEMQTKPMVVFVTAGQQPAIGPGGSYTHVAERLTAMNFDVREWSPAPRQMYGQQMPPGPPPEPDPGQRAIWIVPPLPGSNPMAPQSGQAAQSVSSVVAEQLEKGQAALIMFGPSQSMGFGATDPMASIVEPWGFTPQIDRIVLREVVVSGRGTAADNRMIVIDWPDELGVSAALAGMPGVFPTASPVIVAEKEGTKQWVLARATGRGLWAETDLQNRRPKYNKANAAEAFTIAAAAQKDEGRLVVVADPVWASDRVTTNSDPYVRPGLQGSARLFGAAYPGNAELFVNIVFWLANMDQLIARSARTQDIRRIENMSESGVLTVRWLLMAGLPVLTGAAGLGVWHVRRDVAHG